MTAFFTSIYGHRLGVFQNLTIEEVEKAIKSASSGSYLINISLHKTNQAFSPAQLSLTPEEYSWFRRFLAMRVNLVGGPDATHFFFTLTPNPCKNLNSYFQGAWVLMGLPGKPTFTDLRTPIATHARNTHTSSYRIKVAKFMCHDTSSYLRRSPRRSRPRRGRAVRGWPKPNMAAGNADGRSRRPPPHLPVARKWGRQCPSRSPGCPRSTLPRA
ncbi:uncharacterized protein [Misgurnus anguillicaudatus]|uniref:uncharacterized protein n=1 Tax=Misgurnus anguillicaudatus TaxID=75329 RepID=UPI003CCF6715